jgi:hypothetical protein
MIRFYWRCLKTAATGAWGITSVAASICAIVVAVVVDKHPDWASDEVIAQLNAIGGWIIPVTIFSSLFVVRLLLAPYWLWREMADKIARAELVRPNITVLPLKCTARPQLPLNDSGKLTASVEVTVHLENGGPGEAYSYEIAAYSCWLKNPNQWDKWSDQFFARWPVGVPFEFHFTRFKIAEDHGRDRFGFSVGDELVFVVEVEGRVNSNDGNFFENEQIWLIWEARHPNRMFRLMRQSSDQCSHTSHVSKIVFRHLSFREIDPPDKTPIPLGRGADL